MEQYQGVKPAFVFEMWNNYEKVLVAVHHKISTAFFVPIDKAQFIEQIEKLNANVWFKIEVRDNILYIDGIGIEKK